MFFSFQILRDFPDIFVLLIANLVPLWLENTLSMTRILFFFFLVFIFLFWLCRVLVAACRLLSCSTWTLSCDTRVGSTSLTRYQTRTPCVGSVESYLLDHQGSPYDSHSLTFIETCFMAQNMAYFEKVAEI